MAARRRRKESRCIQARFKEPPVLNQFGGESVWNPTGVGGLEGHQESNSGRKNSGHALENRKGEPGLIQSLGKGVKPEREGVQKKHSGKGRVTCRNHKWKRNPGPGRGTELEGGAPRLK